MGIEGSSEFEFKDFFLDIGSLVIFRISGVGLLEIEFI